MSYQENEISILIIALGEKQSELIDAQIALSEMDDKYEELKFQRDSFQAENKMLLSVIKTLQEQFQIISRRKQND